jgi:hypothetical protein
LSGKTYTDEDIALYLLGSQPAEETERLDELSITDDEFVARLQAVEDELVDSYVRGDLTGEKLQAFNSTYLLSQNRRDKVRFASALHDMTNRAVPREQDPGAWSAKKMRGSGVEKPRRMFLGFGPALQWGLAAAALLLVAAGGWLLRETFILRDQVTAAREERSTLQQRMRELESLLAEQGSSISEKERELEQLRERLARTGQDAGTGPEPASLPNVVSFLLAAPLRGASQIPSLAVPTDADYVALQLEVEASNYPAYRAELTEPGGAAAWRSGRLRLRTTLDTKSAGVSIPASLLKPGRYDLVLYGVSSNRPAEVIATYPIKIEKQ